MDSSRIIVLITGANQGIGYECAKNLVLTSPNYHVLIGSRNASNGAAAATAINADPAAKGSAAPLELDVTSEATVRAAAEHVSQALGRVDAIVHNAAIGEGQFDKARTTEHEALAAILAVNTVGPVLVNDFFLPLLLRSPAPRLVFVSSSGGSLTHASDPTSPYYGGKNGRHGRHFNNYKASKAAVNMLLIQYGKMLEADGVKVMGADPGLTSTNFAANLDKESLQRSGAVEPHVAGNTIAEVVKGERDKDMGRVVGRYGVSPW